MGMSRIEKPQVSSAMFRKPGPPPTSRAIVCALCADVGEFDQQLQLAPGGAGVY